MKTRNSLLSLCHGFLDPTICKINDGQMQKIAGSIGTPSLTDWDFYLPQSLQAKTHGRAIKPDVLFQAAYYFFVQTSLQYCFWYFEEGQQKHWCYLGNPKRKGSGGCVALMEDLYSRNLFPGLHISQDQVQTIAKPFVDGMPLMQTRLDILQEVANPELFRRVVYAPLLAQQAVTTTIAASMAEAFPLAYGDPFLKKAQLMLGLLATNFRSRKVMLNTELTAYADYRVAQVLRHLGVLEYSPYVANMVDNRELIPSDGLTEMALRAATLVACAQLAELTGLTDAQIDNYLWCASRGDDFAENAKPFHLTQTTHY